MPAAIRCHYEVLGVERDADASAVKKQHRKMALKFHPDKNLGNDQASEQFRLVQNAYECLSDPQERKWYDEHREAILAGWSASSSENVDMLFNMIPFMHPGCYSGYHNKNGGFYQVYSQVFNDIAQCERRQDEKLIELPNDFGSADSDWSHITNFYQHWESFVSALNFAWEDLYNAREDAPNRRVKRLMEEENKKARRNAKKIYNQDVVALVAFVKRRDPRVKAKQAELQQQKLERERKQKQEAEERKKEQQKAKEAWKEEAARAMMEAEEEDRLAGRVRLADLEDDYDYGGGKKKRGRGKKKKSKQRFVEQEEEHQIEEPETPAVPAEGSDGEGAEETELEAGVENAETEVMDEAEEPPFDHDAEEYFSEDSSEEEPDIWRCECCKKDFKSEGQMENHMKSKKHKVQFKKYQAKLKQQEAEIMEEMMDDLAVEP